MTNEALSGLPPVDPDREWREGLPPELRDIAATAGRELFCTCMNIGSINAQIHALQSQAAGNQRMTTALRALSFNLNQIIPAFLAAKGWTGAQVALVCTDIERAAALATPSRIVLPGGRVQ